MRSTGGLWGSVGTYTWRGDTCHVTHDTCHESSDRSDEWVDIDSGKRSMIFSFWHWPRERNCWVLNTMWCRDDRWPGPLHQCAVLTFDWSMLVILSSDWSLCNVQCWPMIHRGMRDSQLIILPTGSTRGQLPAHSFASEINFPLTRPSLGPGVWSLPRVMLSSWHSSVLCWEEICSLKIFKIFSLNTQNKHQQGAFCCLLSGSVWALCCCHGPALRIEMLNIYLDFNHFTLHDHSIICSLYFRQLVLLFTKRPLSSAWEYSNSPRIKNLWQPNSNARIMGSSRAWCRPTKAIKAIVAFRDYLRFLVIDLRKGFKILGFCHYHRSDMQNFKYELYTLDLGPSRRQW